LPIDDELLALVEEAEAQMAEERIRAQEPNENAENSEDTAPTEPLQDPSAANPPAVAVPVRTGSGVLVDDDFAALAGKRVGLIAHRPSQVDGRRLADLIDEHPDVELVALFAPEHGLDGIGAAGDAIDDSVDSETGVPIFSLYGLDRSPNDGTLVDVDVLVYDLQDVGTRFFTYTSTLGLSMQAAADAAIEFVVLDRPNPIGSTMQGPTLTEGSESFIGLYNIPSAYALTSGELALLIQEQSLLRGLDDLDLTVIEMQHWRRSQVWADTGLDWISPSPNLPTADAALIYPGTVLFEATTISEGRGTDAPFQLIGAPWVSADALASELNDRGIRGVTFVATTYQPRSILRAAPNPRFVGEELQGVFIEVTDPNEVRGLDVGLHVLDVLLRQGELVGISPSEIIDRPDVFDRLAGSPDVRNGLSAGTPISELVAGFQNDHERFARLARDTQLYDG